MMERTEIEVEEDDTTFLPIEKIRAYSCPATARWIGTALFELALVGAIMYGCWWIRDRWWLAVPIYPIAVFLIGTRQHAMGILAHEGVHYLVHRNKRWNDWLANYLASYAITYPVQGYRTFHLAHHRFLDTPKDPERASVDLFPDEWQFPMRPWKFARILATDLVGSFRKAVRELVRYIWQVPGGNIGHQIRVLLYQGGIVAAFFWFGVLWVYVVFWLLPLFTVAILCFRIRTVAEHSAVAPGQRFDRRRVDTVATTRTTYGGLLTSSFFFGPHHMAYHIEHHLYPSVPVFRLKRLHGELLRDNQFRARAHVTPSYRALWRELTSTPGRGG
jgi:fatty acid desaturase